mmetsp:Transcript_11619/g.27296  ORF Transcript_11619/g.27296 Transcript_11619/m.27296 type:complete len:355 (+) Transcript_11619:63-1127(+)
MKKTRIGAAGLSFFLAVGHAISPFTPSPCHSTSDVSLDPPAVDWQPSDPENSGVGPQAVGIADQPPPRKTGTTIVGVLCKSANAVILGADTRATNGEIVADKRCEKIHKLAPNIYCCGAGTAADAEHLTMQVSDELAELRLESMLLASPRHTYSDPVGKLGEDKALGLPPGEAVDGASRVSAAHCLLKKRIYGAQGSLSCALILGGWDKYAGPSLVSIAGGGSSERVKSFAAQGSGELAAIALLEANWRDDLTFQEAVSLAVKAVKAGVDNDLGSGSCVDLCIIQGHPEGHQSGEARVRYIRAHQPEEALEVDKSRLAGLQRQGPRIKLLPVPRCKWVGPDLIVANSHGDIEIA